MNTMQKHQTPENQAPEIFEVSGLAVDTSRDNETALHYRPEFQTTGKARKGALSAIALDLCTEEGDVKHSMHAEAGKTIDEIMEYIDSGKFNPTKQSNREYVEAKKHNRSKELVPVRR